MEQVHRRLFPTKSYTPKYISFSLKGAVTTQIDAPYPQWKIGAANGESFVLSGQVNYPSEIIRYRPGVGEVLKHAWVQYFSLLMLLLGVLYPLYGWIVRNQIVTTSLRHDLIPGVKLGNQKLHSP